MKRNYPPRRSKRTSLHYGLALFAFLVLTVFVAPHLANRSEHYVHAAETDPDPQRGVEDTNKFKITECGDYIVPGSQLNAVRYTWSSLLGNPTSVTMEVSDKNGNLTRTVNNLPTSSTSSGYAEQKWDGLDSNHAVLTEANSPYTIKLTAVFSQPDNSYCDSKTAEVQEWKLGVKINDDADSSSGFASGTDPTTVGSDTLAISISLDWQTASTPGFVSPLFDVTPATSSANGPDGNHWGCTATPRYVFYVTPDSPYKIEYKMIIAQQNINATTHLGGVRDGVLNYWNMDPSANDRKSTGTWTFGVSPSTERPQPTDRPVDLRKDLQESYQ